MQRYRAGEITYAVATREDESAIRSLLETNSMDAWVAITLRREPDYFAAEKLMGESTTVIAYKGEEKDVVVGMYACTFMQVFFGGEAASIVYLGSLRVQPEFRHAIRYLKHGFDSIPALIHYPASLPFMLTSIASENRRARRVLESNLKGMPTYLPLGELSTLIFAARNDPGATPLVTQARKQDAAAIAAFYNAQARQYDFAPVLEVSWLKTLDGSNGLRLEDFYLLHNSSGEIEAMFALWDQRAIKQTVVEHYRPPLNWLRPLYNLSAAMRGAVRLPHAGSRLEQIFIAFCVSGFGDANSKLALLRVASSLIHARGGKLCTVAMAADDPHRPTIQKALKAAEYATQIEAVFLDSTHKETVHARNIRPEIAVL